jgi:hypothetical protein
MDKMNPMAASEEVGEGQEGHEEELSIPGRPIDPPTKPEWGVAVVQDDNGNVYLTQVHGVPCPAVDKMIGLMGAAYAQATADYSVYNLQVVAYNQQQAALKGQEAGDPQAQAAPSDG